jgi:hypothetical protein
MKSKILIIVLCLACVASFAQTKKKRRTKPKQPTQQPAVVNNPATTVSAIPLPDTIKKMASGPQKPFDRPLDGYFKKTNILSAKPVPYPNLRESDAAFQKRVWREIDIREKMNAYLASPKQRLIDVLMNAIAAGELTAYDPTSNPTKDDPNGDQFSTPLTPTQARNKMADSVSVDKIDKNTGEKIGSTMKYR